MSFLIEILADLFGWLGLRQAEKDLAEGSKKRPVILTVLLVIILAAFFIYTEIQGAVVEN